MRPRRARRAVLAVSVLVCLTAKPVSGQTAAVADLVGLTVVSVEVEREGMPIRDAETLALVETRIGAPLSIERVRETIWHLYSLGGARDVQVDAGRTERGVALRYVIVPLHPPERLVFRGTLGLSERLVRRAVTERYGPVPPTSRLDDVVRTLDELYRDYGYPQARVEAGEAAVNSRPAIVVDVESGVRASIRNIELTGSPPAAPAQILSDLNLASGRPYVRSELEQRLSRYADGLRGRGYYETIVDHDVIIVEDGRALDLQIEIDPGPRVTLAFEGDPLPGDRRDELVPIRREGSVDEDLIEDSARRVEEFLREQGYWQVSVDWRRFQTETDLRLTFEVRQGPRFLVGEVEVFGQTAVTSSELHALIGVSTGEPFVESRVAAGATAATDHYHRLGYPDAVVSASMRETDPAVAAEDTRSVSVHVQVDEGPRTVIGEVRLEGVESMPRGDLLRLMGSVPGRPFYRVQVAQDRDTLVIAYLDRGYQLASAEVEVVFRDDRTVADLIFDVREGPQILVDHVLIAGNTRVGAATIRRELLLQPGEPLGLSALLESQRRLNELGLFRRVQITEIAHGGGNRRDVLVTVDEAPPTTIGYGGGLEGGQRLRRGEGLEGAREQIEFAPRGFFEVGRRNLWGKNRAVNLFTRMSVRPKDAPDDPEQDGRGLGFSEYRVVGTFREPRVLGSRTDMLVTGFTEQAIRSSFNFSRVGAHMELARRLTPSTTLSGRYAYDRTRLFDERFNPEDALLIDRLFPKVTLSSFAGAVIRDTRDDVIDPTRGTFLGADAELAGRAIGAEVGFAKTFVQGFAYRRLPGSTRAVVATGARVGLARGFTREAPQLVAPGDPGPGPGVEPDTQVVGDLPAARRFFAGGDTTVRGFALDRLGDETTIDQDGFPRGGNALLVLNAELRLPVWRDLGAVVFLDAGNVFARAEDFSLARLRGAAGFGLRYRSPVGPIRVDLGFKLDQRTFPSGERERLTALHVSLGQAF